MVFTEALAKVVERVKVTKNVLVSRSGTHVGLIVVVAEQGRVDSA